MKKILLLGLMGLMGLFGSARDMACDVSKTLSRGLEQPPNTKRVPSSPPPRHACLIFSPPTIQRYIDDISGAFLFPLIYLCFFAVAFVAS